MTTKFAIHCADAATPRAAAPSPSSSAWLDAGLEALAATGRFGPYEKEYLLKDGSRRWMLFAGRDLGGFLEAGTRALFFELFCLMSS